MYGQEAINLLYYFTEEEDLVVDPMAGSGVTIDACLIMNRKCRAYDNNPDALDERPDILRNDITRGFPKQVRSKKQDLVVFDPPIIRRRRMNTEHQKP